MHSCFELLCTSFIAVLVLKTLSGDASEVKKALTGYSSTESVMVRDFPLGTTTLYARTQIECIMLCTQRASCLQIYFNMTNGQCSIIPTGLTLMTTVSTEGRLMTIPNPMMLSGRSCSSVRCSSDSVCLSDLSPTFGGAMCAVDSSPCNQDTYIINVKHFYTGLYFDEQDNGIVHTVVFNKTRGDTALRVMWFATTRAHYHAMGCGRYYVTFNGSQCTNPSNIDFVNYDASSNDIHQYSELDGMCYGLQSGVITVSIVVGTCPGYAVSDSYTGWHAGRSMWVYEVISSPSSAFYQCSALPLMNIQHYSITGLDNVLDPDNQLMAFNYQKVASDTVLRVKWLGTARLFLPNDNGYCGRWYITVNGSECSPRAEFIIGMLVGSYNYAIDNHKTRTLEGFCYGLPSGNYTVALRIGSCYSSTGQPDAYTGCCSSTSRMSVSEVRMGTTAQAVATTDGKVIKLPLFNLQHWWWYLLNNGADTGAIVVVTYKKLSDTSGLHLRAVGAARTWGSASCCRWYFTINGVECTNPGAIEGVSYTEHPTDYHFPGVVDGVCYGISSGSYSIGYNVGQCSGFTVADCYTGWTSTLHVIAEESQPDSRVTCADPFTCPN